MGLGLKRAAAAALAASGLPRRLHDAFRRGRLAILAYHGFVREPLSLGDWCFLAEDAFREQMDYLARFFEVVPLAEGLRRLRRGELNRPAAAITFDDGFESAYELAWPILRERCLAATVFLVTGLVGGGDTVWFCRLHGALARTRRRSLVWRRRTFDLAGTGARRAASSRLQTALKSLPHRQLCEELQGIVSDLGDDPQAPVERGSPYRMLGLPAVREMGDSGLVEFGAHTVSHAILSLLDRGEQAEEIEGSLASVRALTGRPCRLFAYPNGRRQDYDEGACRLLAAGGVEAAVTSVSGPNESATPSLELLRYGVGEGESLARFQLAVHHVRSLVPGWGS